MFDVGAITIVVFACLGLFLSLAYLADQQTRPEAGPGALRIVVLAILTLTSAVLAAIGMAYSAVYLLSGLTFDAGSPEQSELFQAVMTNFAPIGPPMLAVALFGFLSLVPGVRRVIARRRYALDPDRTVHLVAFHYVLWLVVVSLLTLVSATELLADEEVLRQTEAQMRSAGATALWAQMAGLVIMAFLGVGVFVSRDLKSAAERLGLLTRPSLRWALAVPALGVLSGIAIDAIWSATSPGSLEELERLSEALFGHLLAMGLLGAITVGVTAGVGEELVFRGALQPRFGLALSTLLFAILHTQYTVSLALVQVFIVGLLLGIARIRHGTVTAILAHALYNTTLFLIAIYAPELSP